MKNKAIVLNILITFFLINLSSEDVCWTYEDFQSNINKKLGNNNWSDVFEKRSLVGNNVYKLPNTNFMVSIERDNTDKQLKSIAYLKNLQLFKPF